MTQQTISVIIIATFLAKSKDSPILYNAYGARFEGKYAAEQDIMFCFSKNTETSKKQEPPGDKNDIIGISSIQIPLRGHSIYKGFHNFYNCANYDQVSYFHDNKSFIVVLSDSSFTDSRFATNELSR